MTHITFDEFSNHPPRSLCVYNSGLDKFHMLTLTEGMDSDKEYITSNLGTSSRVVKSYWSLEKAFKQAVNRKTKRPLYVDRIPTRLMDGDLIR